MSGVTVFEEKGVGESRNNFLHMMGDKDDGRATAFAEHPLYKRKK